MSIANIDGYVMPIFPLDVYNLVESNHATTNLKRRAADYDDGTPLSMLTGTKEGNVVQMNMYLSDAELLNLQRFFTRELYFNVQKNTGTGYTYVDPDMPVIPKNITYLKTQDAAILRRGLSQGTSTFQMYDVQDGIFKKYKLNNDPEVEVKYNRNHISFELYEIGLTDAILQFMVAGTSPDIPSGITIVNSSATDTETLYVYYKGDLFQTIPIAPNTTVQMQAKPSAYYSILYADVVQDIPVISIEGETTIVDFTVAGADGAEVFVKNSAGENVTDADIDGVFTLTGYSFDSVNLADFGIYTLGAPYVLTSNTYNIVKSIADTSTKVINFVIPQGTVTWENALGSAVVTPLYVDGASVSDSDSPYVDNYAVGAHIFSIPAYNVTATGSAVEGASFTVAMTIPAVRIVLTDSLYPTAIPDHIRLTRNGTVITTYDLSNVDKRYENNEVNGSAVTYGCQVRVSTVAEEWDVEYDTGSTDALYFEPSTGTTEAAGFLGYNEVYKTSFSHTFTYDLGANISYIADYVPPVLTFTTAASTSYTITIDGVLWYDSSYDLADQLFYIGTGAVVVVKDGVTTNITAAEGGNYSVA